MLTEEQKEEYKKLNNDDDLNDCFIDACSNGHLEIVKYLLTSKDLKEHSDIHADNDYGFRWACHNEKIEVVKYLLTSDELKEHADIHALNDYGFRWACNNEKIEVVKYLIFDYNIEKTKAIINFLNENKGKDWEKEVSEMFASRDLKEDLSNSLNSGKNKSKIKL